MTALSLVRVVEVKARGSTGAAGSIEPPRRAAASESEGVSPCEHASNVDVKRAARNEGACGRR